MQLIERIEMKRKGNSKRKMLPYKTNGICFRVSNTVLEMMLERDRMNESRTKFMRSMPWAESKKRTCITHILVHFYNNKRRAFVMHCLLHGIHHSFPDIRLASHISIGNSWSESRCKDERETERTRPIKETKWNKNKVCTSRTSAHLPFDSLVLAVENMCAILLT